MRDIRNIARIRAVLLNGRALSRADLDALLMTAERMARESQIDGR